VPAAIPVAWPVAELTVALVMLLLLHVPPAVVLPSVTSEPVHTLVVPVIAATAAITVAVVVLLQPVARL
jgi:4-amino-4-deoxy-L-arabinose transferase-like glycosyltransferase